MNAEQRTESGRPTPQSPELVRPRRVVFRADIQALRALAVGLVVLNHLWPHRMTGGFVGVDVFFVISGFLITTHLFKELSATSKIDLGKFYARRVKRLLPAAFLVLAVSSLAVYLWVPYSQWTQTAREAMMSVLYIENWSLAAQSVDYSALNDQATIAQHYWSLSVEEQFYFFWPLALYGLYVLGRKVLNPRAALAAGVGMMAMASLIFSVYFTAMNPSPAYFATPVRVWEFAFGGLLALLATKLVFSRAASSAVAAAGWLTIIVAAFRFGPETQFPGWTALLPVMGTVAVIAAGMNQSKAPLKGLVSWKPVQLVGDISYSIYLWHWPMIVVAPFVLAEPLNSWHKLAVLLLCLPLAWGTKILVEDQARAWRILGVRPRATFAAMGVGIVILGLVSSGLVAGALFKQGQAQVVAAQLLENPCSGPAALPMTAKCEDALGPAAVTVMGDSNKYYASAPGCAVDPSRKRPGVDVVGLCDYSDGSMDAESVWLTGDSHAEQWQLAVMELAKVNKWKLSYALLGGCPVADVSFKGFRGKTDEKASKACTTGSQSIAKMIEEEKPSKVFYSIFAREEQLDDGSRRSQEEQYVEGLPKFWLRWAAVGSDVVVLADPPLNGSVRDSNCVTLNPNDPLRCAVDRKIAQPSDPLIAAAKSLDSERVKLVDLTDHFCDQKLCYAVVGNMPVYFDKDHLNGEFSALMAPFIARKL
ncbi:acyltransferase family protein [Specibacter sp. NPDC078709]|uniref:acyltransferase family protein n=1 Tax=Specibacter sp. NPDC078709 TaxID=3154364 RepID=UPI0034289A2A